MIEEEFLPAEPRGTFLGHVNIVVLTYALDGALAFVQGALIARALGPDGRGVYSLFVVSAAFAQVVLALGLGNASIYYLNKRALPVRSVVSAAHVATVWSLVVAGLAILLIEPWTGDTIFGGDVPDYFFIIAVPVLVYSTLLKLVLQAMSRFVELGATIVVQPIIMLMLIAGAMATGRATASTIVVFWMIAHGVASLIALSRIGLSNVDVRQIIRPRWATLRSLLGFGIQGEAGNILQLLNYRLDQYLVRVFVSLAGVGIYAVGVSMTEAIWMLANAVAIVLVPRLTLADPEEARRMTPVATRNTVLLATAGALALAAVAPILVPLVFGDAYRPSVDALWLLLPGTVALTGSKVLTGYIFSQGRPLVNTAITVLALSVTLAADLILIPAFGVNGAAAASSLTYVAHFAAALIAYRMISGQPALAAVVPRGEDVRLYADALRGIVARLSRHRTIEADVAHSPRG